VNTSLEKKQTIQTSQKGNPGASISNLFQERFEELQTYFIFKADAVKRRD
jgi:hypothetical protein